VVPHTSWHDFYIAIFTRKTLGVMVNFVGKKNCLFGPSDIILNGWVERL
jgi:hypothetical protein